jgi:hypothetical protein
MFSIRWISKKQQELEDREQAVDEKERKLKLIFLDMVIKAKDNQIKRLDDLYFEFCCDNG